MQPYKIPNALDEQQQIKERLKGKNIIFFFDYDGTLTPIVSRPDLAILSEEGRQLLTNLAKKYTVAIFSGRDRANIQQLVPIPGITYAGSHGLEIGTLEKILFENEEAKNLIPQIEQVHKELDAALKQIEGVLLERKRFSVAVHYRMVPPEKRDILQHTVDKILKKHPSLRKRMGKMVYEIEPDLPWDKGAAVLWFLKTLGLEDAKYLPLYFGDDVTDEDAFKVLANRGICVAIQEFPKPTKAGYYLEGPVEVHSFLASLLD